MNEKNYNLSQLLDPRRSKMEPARKRFCHRSSSSELLWEGPNDQELITCMVGYERDQALWDSDVNDYELSCVMDEYALNEAHRALDELAGFPGEIVEANQANVVIDDGQQGAGVMENEDEPDALATGIAALELRHGNAIRTYVRIRPLQDVFNFDLRIPMPILREVIFDQQQVAIKINASYGFILRNNESGELRYFHSSMNNARLLPAPVTVRNADDFEAFERRLEQGDILTWARDQRPNSKWMVIKVTNLTVYVSKLLDHPIGFAPTKLPPHIRNNKAILGLVMDMNSGRPYTDRLCLFRCLALQRGAPLRGLAKLTKRLFRETYPTGDIETFPGVPWADIEKVEERFKVNIFVYQCTEEQVATLVRRSPTNYAEEMYLNLHEAHFSYIVNRDRYCKSYACTTCGKLWKHVGMLHRHQTTCIAETVYRYPGGVYHPPPTIFDELRDGGFEVDESAYPYRATYDFECYFDRSDIPTNSDKVIWEARHVPLSVSVCSNVPGFQEPVCFVTEGDTDELVLRMMTHLKQVADAAYIILQEKHTSLLQCMDEQLQEQLVTDPVTKGKHPLEQLIEKFQSYLMELPVIGFNSGKYDLNAIKVAIMRFFTQYEPINFVVKKNNNFLCLKSDNFKFLDICNYLAPGCNYDKYLKAYHCSVNKACFPYEWVTLDRLNHRELPSHADFYSSLRNENISEADYIECQRAWESEGMTCFKDYLKYYNNIDVVPFLEALEKQSRFYEERNIDMFKQGISVPGLTLNYMFQDLDCFFSLVDGKNEDLYWLIKNNIVGGPSIVFHRYHEKNVTRIRQVQYQDQAKLCRGIVGYDANALYLYALAQEMPSGHPVRRVAPDFAPITTDRRHVALEWLDFVAHTDRIHIRHQRNHFEKRFGARRLPVDGWCVQNQTIYQFHGCYWHGHPCTGKTHNVTRDKAMADLLMETRQNTAYLRKLGYTVVEQWECEWRNQKRQSPLVKAFINTLPTPPLPAMTQEEILSRVRDGSFFGMVEVDLHVPDHLKDHFQEMTPIFKNINICREDIGPVMGAYAEQHKIMTQPWRSLIGSYRGEKLLLATPLLKWYLNHGLVVTRIYQTVEYEPKACFRQFADRVSNARRTGDADPNQAIVADTMKLLGNSGYGRTVTNQTKHRKVKYVDERGAAKLINDKTFRTLNELDESTYEVEMAKASISLNLPHQIGFFVYQYAKLRMLEFYFEFVAKYVDRCDFEYCEMDTDSAYFAVSGRCLEEVVKPDLREAFYREWDQWMPAVTCQAHHEEWVNAKCSGQVWVDQPCCLERQKFDKRTPGLFKEEWCGDGIVSLCSKTYYCFGHTDKTSCKGLNKNQNTLNKDKYLKVLREQQSGSGVNRGFRCMDNQMFTYAQSRASLSYFYPKRKVLTDGVSTRPLLI